MKKKVITLATATALLFASVSATQTKDANAILALSTGVGGGVLLGTGMVLSILGMGAGLGGLWGAENPDPFSSDSAIQAAVDTAWIGAAALAVGIVLLDDQQRPTLAFSKLDEKGADRLGVSSRDCEDFNQNLDELNAVVDNVSADIERNHDASALFVREDLRRYLQNVSSGAVETAQKVAAQIQFR